MDSGSAITMITKRFANSLQMKHHKHQTTIGGVGSHSSDINSIVNLMLTLAVFPDGEELEVQAHVVENICFDHCQQDLDYLKKIPMLKGKSLADPYFGQHGHLWSTWKGGSPFGSSAYQPVFYNKCNGQF